MPTRNINLARDQDDFIDEIVETGEYQNASEAVRQSLRLLRQRRSEDALKLKVLRAQVRAGADALERGDFLELDRDELEKHLSAPGRTGRSRLR